eukprot:3808578-Pleurochrysis_carterae.AAC.2
MHMTIITASRMRGPWQLPDTYRRCILRDKFASVFGQKVACRAALTASGAAVHRAKVHVQVHRASSGSVLWRLYGSYSAETGHDAWKST